nr:hypothetical protein [Variovorax boronicumulans]
MPTRPFDATRFPAIEALLRFEGQTLAGVLSGRAVQPMLYGSYRSAQAPLAGESVPLPISPQVRYHAIIGQADRALPRTEASDGIVPYASAHLPGAASERVLPYEHSVQEHPLTILKIRRIPRESLNASR